MARWRPWPGSTPTTEGETRLGALDAASFVGSIADEVLADYLEVVEDIEREIDRLDQRALHAPGRPRRPEQRSSGSAAGSASSGGRSRRTVSRSPPWRARRWPSTRSSASRGRA